MALAKCVRSTRFATSWSSDADLSDAVLVGAKHTKAAAADISLTGDGELKGISAARTDAMKDPKVRRPAGRHRPDA